MRARRQKNTGKWFVGPLVLLTSIILASCSFISPEKSSEYTLQTMVAKSLQLTQISFTLTAIVPTATVTTQVPTPLPPTETPTTIPEPSATPTMGGVWLTLSENTNCRSGPAAIYDWLGVIDAGTEVEVLGVNPYNDYYYVRNPRKYSEYCWLWGQYTSVVGNVAFLPVLTPMPTPTQLASPTPTLNPADFKVSYIQTVTCNGHYAIELLVTNTGVQTWESIRVVLKDNTDNRFFVHELDTFRGTLKTDACELDVANLQKDLSTGESSPVACINPGQMDYNPAGHSFTATVALFADDGRKGTTVTKIFNFVP